MPLSTIEIYEYFLCDDYDSRATSPLTFSAGWQTPSRILLLQIRFSPSGWMTKPKILPAYGMLSRGSPASLTAAPQPQPPHSSDQRAKPSTPSAVSQARTLCLQDQPSEAAGRQESQIVASASTIRSHVSLTGQLSPSSCPIVRNRPNVGVVCSCWQSLLMIAVRMRISVKLKTTGNSQP